jgi:hypothetical protein
MFLNPHIPELDPGALEQDQNTKNEKLNRLGLVEDWFLSK